MVERLPWFRCFPSALLGALSGLSSDEGLIYVTVILRIYETGGAVSETGRTLARRTGLTEKRAAAALDALVSMGKVQRVDGGLVDCANTHDELEWQRNRKGDQSQAGKASAAKRASASPRTASGKKDAASAKNDKKSEDEKHNKINETAPTAVERALNHKEEDREEEEAASAASAQRGQRGSERRAEAPEVIAVEAWLRSLVVDLPIIVEPDFRPILLALADGVTREDVERAVADYAAKASRRLRHWADLVPWARRAAKDRIAASPAAIVARHAAPAVAAPKAYTPTHMRRVAVEFYRGELRQGGPAALNPAHPDCVIPAEILAEARASVERERGALGAPRAAA